MSAAASRGRIAGRDRERTACAWACRSRWRAARRDAARGYPARAAQARSYAGRNTRKWMMHNVFCLGEAAGVL